MGGGGTEREGEGEGERQMTQPHTIQCVTLQKYEAHFPASQGVVPAEYGGGSVLAGEYERQCRHHQTASCLRPRDLSTCDTGSWKPGDRHRRPASCAISVLMAFGASAIICCKWHGWRFPK